MARDISHKQVSRALDSFQAAKAREGDRRAFEGLYKRWHAPLLRFAYRQIGHPEMAKDVMQDAALAMAKNIHRLNDPEMFSNWAYTIVRRRCADHIKSNIKDRHLKTKFAAELSTEAVGHSAETMSIRQGLAKLPDTERLLLTLFYVEGLTGAELAAAMGLPLGTVKSRLFTARQHLKLLYETTSKGDENE
ncbi:MAG: sigma-70 family RNA polymerase sigma factor [Hellea sp.]